MEKRRPTYDLKRIKEAFASVRNLGRATTATAFRNAQELGVSREDMIEVIRSLQTSDFYKSMTAYANPRRWQDVYHTRFRDRELYIKFTVKPDGGYLLLSFKEK